MQKWLLEPVYFFDEASTRLTILASSTRKARMML